MLRTRRGSGHWNARRHRAECLRKPIHRRRPIHIGEHRHHTRLVSSHAAHAGRFVDARERHAGNLRMATAAMGIAMGVTAPGFALVAVAAAATLALTACSSTGSAGESRTALQSYSCCSSEDILAVRHPGEVMPLHWITAPAGPSAHGAVTPVRLEASLSGPFASISELKRSESSGMV